MARQELRTSQLTKAKIMLVEAFEDGDSSMSLSIVGSRSVRLLVSLAQSRRHERISEWKSHRDGVSIGSLIGHYCCYVTALGFAATIYDRRFYDRRRSFWLRRSNCSNNSCRSTVIRLLERARGLVLKRRLDPIYAGYLPTNRETRSLHLHTLRVKIKSIRAGAV